MVIDVNAQLNSNCNEFIASERVINTFLHHLLRYERVLPKGELTFSI